MYYTVIPTPCQLLFAGTCVAFKQQAAEQGDAPSGHPIDLVDAIYGTNQGAVPQHVHWPAEQEAKEDNKGDSANDSSDNVHINL